MTQSLPGTDPRLDPFILVTQVAEGRRFAESIFQRKYLKAAPDVGHHILVFYHSGPGHWLPACYLNYRHFEGALLIGGACTDGRVLRAMTPEQRALLDDCGGLMMQSIRYVDSRFADQAIGVFGYCGDKRAWSIMEQLEYQRVSGHPYLIVRWNREPDPATRDALIARVDAFGAF